ncbi:MAG: glycosyltransferase [Chthoniobacterales bacterium]
MSRFILLPIGSSGDVNPFLWTGRHLHERGHDVTVIANPYFARQVESAGLHHVPIGTEDEYHALTDDPKIWHPIAGTTVVLGYAGDITARYFDLIRQTAGNEKPILLAPCTAFGARLAREKLGLPLITVNLQPSIFRSIYETAYFGRGFEYLQTIPRWLKRVMFALIDLKMNRVVSPGVVRACREQGVQPPRNAFRDWWQSPNGVLCLWPEWYAAPQHDWPANARCIGFPLEDLASHHTTNPELEAFLAAGETPVLFTPGTAMAQGRAFFDAALGACVTSKRRAIFVTRYPDQLPANLPSTVRHFDYLPFSDVLPRCSAIVHHGGIGTTSQAFAAGIPQLIMPLAHDQPDNADRVRRLGAGSFLWPREFTAQALVRELDVLLAQQSRCEELALRVNSDKPADALLAALSHVGPA